MNPHKEPTFDGRIADWLEGLDDRAPNYALGTVLAATRSLPQRRAWRAPWRLRSMNRLSLIGATAAVGLALVVGGMLLIGPRLEPSSGVGGAPPTAHPSESPTATLDPVIPDGTYVGAEQPVSDILDRLEGDPTLTEPEKTAIIDSVLGIRGATTYQTRIEILGQTLVLDQNVDGTSSTEEWTITPISEKRIAARWAGGTIDFEVRGCGQPGPLCGFTLQALTPAPSNVEAFVRKLVFEISGPFEPAD